MAEVIIIEERHVGNAQTGALVYVTAQFVHPVHGKMRWTKNFKTVNMQGSGGFKFNPNSQDASPRKSNKKRVCS